MPDGRDERAELLERIEQLFAEQRFGVLCTCRPSGAPYGNLVAVAAVDGLHGVLFATLRTTRKWENLAAEPRVALVMDNRQNRVVDLREAMGLTVRGEAHEVVGEPLLSLESQFLERHPQLTEFLSSPECALMRIRVATLSVVTRFQQVLEVDFDTEGTP